MSKEKEITIASYNVASGGYEEYSYELKIPKRVEQIKEAVRIIDADFVSLVDTFRWDEEFSTEQLQQMFDYQFAHTVNLQDKRLIEIGHNNGITVLTNLNVVESKPIFIHTRNCIRTIVEVGNNRLQIFSAYLDDKREETRLKQIEEMLEHVDESFPAVIMGDLNASSKNTTKEASEGLMGFYSKHPDLIDEISSFVEEASVGEVIERLIKVGFRTAADGYAPTVPTPIFMNLGFEIPIIQLDHILIKGNLESVSFNVFQGGVFDKASDHYPVIAKITF